MPISEEEFRRLNEEVIRIRTKTEAIESTLIEHKLDTKRFQDVEWKKFQDKMDEREKTYFGHFMSKEAFTEWVKNAFSPIQKIVWAVIGMIGMAVIGGGLAFLIKKP
jgi:hypothetical protein